MKAFFMLLFLTISVDQVYAQCCNPKPACPKVRTKIVTKVVEKPVIVEKEKVVVVKQDVPYVMTRTFIKKVQKKNRISLLGGTGPTKVSATSEEVRLERGAVVGVQYQRMLGDALSVGIQVQSNQTVLGSVGIDF